MVELKPCPFCGGTNITIDNNEVGDGDYGCAREANNFWGFCQTCSAMGGEGETEEGAIAAWNKRVKLENLYRLGEALMVPITEEDGTEVIQRCKQCKEAEK